MQKRMKWWYIAQYLVFIAILTFANLMSETMKNLPISLVLGFIMLTGVTLTLLEKEPTKPVLVFRWFEALAYPVSLSLVSSFLSQKIESIPFALFLAIYLLVTALPVLYSLLPIFKSVINRILFSVQWFFIGGVPSIAPRLKVPYPLLRPLFTSGFWGSLAAAVFALALMRSLGFSFYDWKPTRKLSVLTLSFIGNFAVYFTLFNAFSIDNNWLDTLFVFDFSNFKPTPYLFWTAVRAGVFEEILCRYIFLLSFLYIWRHQKYQINLAILVSSAIFGLLHITNLMGGQDLIATLSQVIFAILIGFLLSSIYLYTGKLWTVILFHILIDVFAFSSTGSSMMEAMSINDFFTPHNVYMFLFLLLFSVWMLTGKRKNIIRTNVQHLFEQKKSDPSWKVRSWLINGMRAVSKQNDIDTAL